MTVKTDNYDKSEYYDKQSNASDTLEKLLCALSDDKLSSVVLLDDGNMCSITISEDAYKVCNNNKSGPLDKKFIHGAVTFLQTVRELSELDHHKNERPFWTTVVISPDETGVNSSIYLLAKSFLAIGDKSVQDGKTVFSFGCCHALIKSEVQPHTPDKGYLNLTLLDLEYIDGQISGDQLKACTC